MFDEWDFSWTLSASNLGKVTKESVSTLNEEMHRARLHFFLHFFIYLKNISWKCGFTFTFDFMITWIMAALWLRFSYFPGLQAHDVNLSMYQSYDRISYGVAVLLLMLR